MSESTEKKPANGCLYYVIRFIAIIIALNFLFWLLAMGFHKLYPPTPVTQALVAFQNNYLAFTDAFVTSEMGSSELTSDPGPISRLLFSAVLIVVVSVILLVIIALIPGLNRLGKYITGWFFGTMILAALIHASFIPGTITVVNQKNQQLEVTNFSWGIIPDKKKIPFDSIQNFDYKLHEYWGHDHNYTIYAQLLAEVNGQKIFLGENEIGSHDGHQAEHDEWKMPADRQKEIEAALQSLRELTRIKN